MLAGCFEKEGLEIKYQTETVPKRHARVPQSVAHCNRIAINGLSCGSFSL